MLRVLISYIFELGVITDDFMKEIWERIENWIKANSIVILDTLNPGATEQDFIHFKSVVGLDLPEPFKEFLSIHNGQTWTHLKLFDSDRLLSIEDIISEWGNWNDVSSEIDAQFREEYGMLPSSLPEKGIKADWWNHAWLPITSNGSGDSYCIDLDPTQEGQQGQIIRMWHDAPERELIAHSFSDWISKYVNDLENAVYVPSDDIGWGGIVRKEE